MFKLHCGDCLEVIKILPDNSVDSVVTDPPYGLSFMGKKWDYDVPAQAIWEECLRVLKPGGHLLAFAGTRTQHRMAIRIEDAGFEIRDMIAWVYGSGFPKSHNLEGDWDGWGTALKPALEPITVARKPLIGTVAQNVLEHNTGALNIDGCRVATQNGEPAYSYPNGPGGIYSKEYQAKNNIAKDWNNFSTIADNRASQGSDLGRWPANLIHDGSDEVVKLFPNSKAGKDTGERGIGGMWSEGNGIPVGQQYGDSSSAARFFYCAKASKADRDEGLNQFKLAAIGNDKGNGIRRVCNKCGAYQLEPCDCVGKEWVLPANKKNNHPTVKPTDLMRYLCRLVTPPNGTVLDPFMGSGSTGKAAMLEGFKFIGIEREKEYITIAEARIANAIKDQQLELL